MPDQGEEELFPEIAKQDLEEKINEVLLKVQPGFKLLPEDEKHKSHPYPLRFSTKDYSPFLSRSVAAA